MKIRNNNILRPSILIKLLWIIILAGACQNDDRYDVPQNDSPVLVEFSVATSGVSDTSESSTDADARITSIYILQFNAQGESYGTLRYVAKGTETPGGKYAATLLQSMGANDNYKLVILANLPDYGFLYGMYNKPYDEVQQTCLSAESTSPLVFDEAHSFPMFGVVNGGASVQVQENTQYTGNTELIRAVARVDLGIGQKSTAADGTVTWTKNSSTPFKMTEIQVWKAGKRYAYMPAPGNFHWNTVTNGGGTSSNIVTDKPSTASGGTATVTYGDTYITSNTYCSGQIYLPEADLLWGTAFDGDHTNRLAIIVGGYYNKDKAVSYYRVDFTNDVSGAKMNILRNHKYQFTITKVADKGYDTAEIAYNNRSKNLVFEATLEPWTEGQTASIPSILGYYLAYQGFNGENVEWTYAENSSLQIPKKQSYWGTNKYLPFNYDNFYKEGNRFYYPDITGGQNGILYNTVADALNYEGTFPYLMVASNDMVDESGHGDVPWKTGTALTAFDLCRNLEENGYDDWRLPRLSELAFIYVNQESLKALRGFTPLSGNYWCGSEYLLDTPTDEQLKKSDWAWAVNFTDDTGYASSHKKTEALKIRCVRQKLNDK